MACESCGEKPKDHSKDFTKAVVEINNPEKLVLLRKVMVPASMGDDIEFPPEIGKFYNVILQYEANGVIYLYSSDGIPTKINASVPQEVIDRISTLEGEYISLSSALSAEEEARINADGVLQAEIDAIKNSPDVVDIVATYADLQAYDTSSLGTDDIVRVLRDEMHDGASTYYRWNDPNAGWNFIGTVGDYYTISQVDTLLAGKQDTLIAGENITIDNNVISATGGQSDWAENDSTNPAYIKNRTHYEEEIATDIPRGQNAFDGGTTAVTGYSWEIQQVDDYFLSQEISDFADGDTIYAKYTYSVDGVEKSGEAKFTVTVEDDKYSLDSDMPLGSAWNGAYAMEFDTNTTFRWPVETVDTSATIYLTNVTYTRVKQLDAKYIPVDGNTVKVNANGELEADVQGGPTVVQTTGTSITDVMSQNATTSMVYADPGTRRKICIGADSSANGVNGVAIGYGANANTSSNSAVAIGNSANVEGAPGGIALGAYSRVAVNGQMNIGTTDVSYGYNNSNYRLLTGLYDPQNAHDAATKGYVDAAIAGGGGGVTELTSADYNYPTGNPTTIATWLLQPGIYHNAQGVKTRFAAGESDATDSAYWFIGEVASGSTSLAWYKIDGDSFSNIITGTTNNSTGAAVDSWKRYLTTAAVAQTTGTSTANVMSQNATTKLVYANYATKQDNQIGIGKGVSQYSSGTDSIIMGTYGVRADGNRGIAIGYYAEAAGADDITIATGTNRSYNNGTGTVVIGANALSGHNYSVVIGDSAQSTRTGEVNVGAGNSGHGYNSTNYRVIGGVHDGQSAHDAATKGQLDGVVLTNAGAPTTSTVGTVGQLLEDTTNGKLYICTAASGGTYTWEEVGAGGGGGSAMVELTSADYNYHSAGSTDDGVALWLLPAGEYYIASNTKYYISATTPMTVNMDGTSFKIWKSSSGASRILYIGPGGIAEFYNISSTGAQADYVYYLTNGAVAQSTGTSTALVMSQNATTSMIYADPSTRVKIQIGANASVTSGANNGVAIGSGTVSATAGGIAIGNAWNSAQVSGNGAIAIGSTATGYPVSGQGSISLGAFTPQNATAGVIEVGSTQTAYGYSSSNYRLLSGLYDPQSAHDAATKGYVDSNIPSAFTTSEWNALWA